MSTSTVSQVFRVGDKVRIKEVEEFLLGMPDEMTAAGPVYDVVSVEDGLMDVQGANGSIYCAWSMSRFEPAGPSDGYAVGDLVQLSADYCGDENVIPRGTTGRITRVNHSEFDAPNVAVDFDGITGGGYFGGGEYVINGPDLALLQKPGPTYTQAEVDELLSQARGDYMRLVEQERSTARGAMQDFHRTVAQVAVRFATEHGWCAEVKEALSEMGIDPELAQPPLYEFTVVRTYRVTARRTDSNLYVEPEEHFIRSSLKDDLDLDADWEDVSVEVIDTDVNHIEQA